ncbi:MAG: formate--tetrahydrofolate ligase [Hyphomicrobiales bacterium]
MKPSAGGLKMASDIEIARQARLLPITEIGARLGIPDEALEPYGHDKAKIGSAFIEGLAERPDGRLILVTAMSPTPAGEGKTTTSVGLTDALNRIGKRAAVCLREPSLGPCFGVKGGAAGGGLAQVVPMEDINLHFTGDFHAITAAHNLLSAMIDNHIHWDNRLDLDPRRITWRRVVDMNDRALREIVVGLGGPANGYPRESGYDISVASEVMAILCLADDLGDLQRRLGNIVVGQRRDRTPVTAGELDAAGAMTVLLKDAIKPNLVQTLENNPAFIHGGPFANIAHGCNSLAATRTALKLADYVVTEAGFGADLGAEKFFDIKCRKGGLVPAAAVVVATIRALKFHGGVARADLAAANVEAVERGLENLGRHLRNVAQFGVPAVVAINHFAGDTDEEVEAVRAYCAAFGVRAHVCKAFAEGGAGAVDLAADVVRIADGAHAQFRTLYDDRATLWEKTRTIARSIYGADDIIADKAIRDRFRELDAGGYGRFPVCIAKTPYSFSTDPNLKGAPTGHVVPIREVRLAAGAEFLVVICGDVMTMPGLPRVPAATKIGIGKDGLVEGLF